VSRRIQSVNTLRREGGKWLGCNTDVTGFLAPLESAMRCAARARRFSARAAPRDRFGRAGLARRARHDRRARQDQAQSVAALTGAAVAQWPPDPASWDLLVNATPVGTAPTRALAAARRLSLSRRRPRVRPGLQPAAHALLADADAPAAAPSAASTCSSPRRRRSSNGGPAAARGSRDARRGARRLRHARKSTEGQQ
jgi:hypothetical protein